MPKQEASPSRKKCPWPYPKPPPPPRRRARPCWRPCAPTWPCWENWRPATRWTSSRSAPPTGRRSTPPRTCSTCWGRRCRALAQEQLRVLLLNTRNQVMGQRIVYQGNVNSSIVRPAEVLRAAVIESAPSIIIAHNHPSRRSDAQSRGRFHHPRPGAGRKTAGHRPAGPHRHRRRQVGQPQGKEADGQLAIGSPRPAALCRSSRRGTSPRLPPIHTYRRQLHDSHPTRP